MPCAASMTSRAPSQAASERETSLEKSTWPGVSMKFSSYVSPSRAVYVSVTGCILIVIPRSRSRSIASSSCSSIARCSTVLVNSSRRSLSVVLPWSMCAMMQKLRTCAGPRVAAADSDWITRWSIQHAGAELLRDHDVRVDQLDDDDDDEERE